MILSYLGSFIKLRFGKKQKGNGDNSVASKKQNMKGLKGNLSDRIP